MAWRIHDSVIRGEIDNRERDFVRGKIWLQGVAEPVLLELKGNACPDLAGCLLTFENTKAALPLRPDAKMWPVQRGTAGDMTASRKVRVFDIPFEEAYAKLKKKLPVPEHMANCLYLEWFSHNNGRVVVESTECKLTVSAANWKLSPEEDEKRREQSAEGFNTFMQQLSAALEAQHHEPPEDKEWDEFDYEKFMREGDARTDKYAELLDKYRDHPDRERIIAKEMGWSWLEEALEEQEKMGEIGREDRKENSGEPKSSAEEKEQEERGGWDFPDDIDEPVDDLQPDPATEGVDWIRDENGYPVHPLSLRARNSSMDLWRKCEDLGPGKEDDPDLEKLINEYQTASVKLAGALDGLAFGRHLSEGAFTVAYLKRALNYLHAAQAALERVTPKQILPTDVTNATRAELFGLREEILRLMQEFRKKK